MDTRPIGMLDSGMGGVTVLAEIKKELPKENIIYYGDTLHFPYGNKSRETILELTQKGISFLVDKGVKAIVIACGTATSQALEELQSQYTIPIIGIIKPTIEEIAKRNYSRIGVIGTAGTIRSKAWENALKQVLPDSTVYSKACPLLAPMAEEGWTDNEIARLTVKEYVKDFKEKKLEGLILGCTHYSFFQKWIQQELGKEVSIINTGEMVSKTIKKILQEQDIQNLEEEKEVEIYLTNIECNMVQMLEKYLPKKQITYSILHQEEK